MPPPANAAEKAPASFHVSGPTHAAIIAPEATPPTRLPKHAAPYAISIGRPAFVSSRMSVPMITNTIAYGIANVKTASCIGPVCAITPIFASTMPS